MQNDLKIAPRSCLDRNQALLSPPLEPLASFQIRAARALLRRTADDLAGEAALGRNIVLSAE